MDTLTLKKRRVYSTVFDRKFKSFVLLSTKDKDVLSSAGQLECQGDTNLIN